MPSGAQRLCGLETHAVSLDVIDDHWTGVNA
jgi:hypothetical protein